MCNEAQRELVCRHKAFGPSLDPYSEELNSEEYKPQLIGGSVPSTINAYAPGGQCFNSMPDNGYWAAHASPQNFGWTWASNKWNPPPEGDPKGMRWDGKKQAFVGPLINPQG